MQRGDLQQMIQPNKQDLFREVERGRRFQELQKLPAFQELIEEADRGILKKWQQCRINDDSTQKEAKLELEAIKKLNLLITGFINIGNVASGILEKLDKKVEEKNEGRI